jgi:hypothetical protein
LEGGVNKMFIDHGTFSFLFFINTVNNKKVKEKKLSYPRNGPWGPIWL